MKLTLIPPFNLICVILTLEQKADYSTNGSEIKLNEILQADNEERIKILEKKIEDMFNERNNLSKEIQILQFDNNILKRENGELQESSKIIQEKYILWCNILD